MSVAVVTDSTAYLPAELVDAYGLTVVPLTVVLNGAEGLEGVEFFPADAARALREKRARVSTSRPAPEVSSPAPTGGCSPTARRPWSRSTSPPTSPARTTPPCSPPPRWRRSG